MIIVVTGGVAAGKSTLIGGLAAGLAAVGRGILQVSDRARIHDAVLRGPGGGGPGLHAEVLRHRPDDVPGLDTRIALFDAYHLVQAREFLLRCMHEHAAAGSDDVLAVEWATGPRVDFSRGTRWSGDEAHRWLDQALDDVLDTLGREGLLPLIRLLWIDRWPTARDAANAVRRDAVPDDDFSLLGGGGGGLHELSADGLRLAASLREGDRFRAVRNAGSREDLVRNGEAIGRAWGARAEEEGIPGFTAVQRGWIEGARELMRRELAGDAGGHDPSHVERVWRLARRLVAAAPAADRLVVELAALLHDVDDWKRLPPGAEEGTRTRDWLEASGMPEAVREKVLAAIRQVSFHGAGHRRPDTIEAALVQDADRLDALGAVGIARLFAYGGSRGRPMHDPDVPPAVGMDAAAYRSHRGTSVNHIHEKILHLSGLLNTAGARALGGPRHRFVEEFLARFLDEWEGLR